MLSPSALTCCWSFAALELMEEIWEIFIADKDDDDDHLL